MLLGGLAKATLIGELPTRASSAGFNRMVTKIFLSTGFGFGTAVSIITAVLLIVSGVLVLTGALMLNSLAQQFSIWGVVILVFSAVGLFAGGGFLASVGSLLGMVAGVLAITARSAQRTV